MTGANRMTDLVVGGRGNLGRQLLSDLPNGIGTSRYGSRSEDKLDITDGVQVMEVVERVQPRYVINTAAMTSVDACERDPDAARSVHVDGTANLVRACEEAGSRLIQLSTNYVFDGENGPYDENDTPNPLSVYGRTKLESERLVLEAPHPGIVIRTAVFYGTEAERPNFVTWALRELVLGKPIRIVTDESANPTYVPDLSRAISQLVLDVGHRGVFHVAGTDFLNRYEMVVLLCDVFGLDSDLVNPVVSEDLGQDAVRPPRAGLNTARIRAVVDRPFGSFRANLIELKDQIGDLVSWARSD